MALLLSAPDARAVVFSTTPDSKAPSTGVKNKVDDISRLLLGHHHRSRRPLIGLTGQGQYYRAEPVKCWMHGSSVADGAHCEKKSTPEWSISCPRVSRCSAPVDTLREVLLQATLGPLRGLTARSCCPCRRHTTPPIARVARDEPEPMKRAKLIKFVMCNAKGAP